MTQAPPQKPTAPSRDNLNERLFHNLGLIRTIGRMPSLFQGELLEGAKELTELLGNEMQVHRVSIWKFSAGETRLECVDLFELVSGTHYQGGVIDALMRDLQDMLGEDSQPYRD